MRGHSSSLRVQLDPSIALRSGTYLDDTYLIVPVISQVGDTVVWPANAPSPEFIPADVLQLATESRNGHPVVVGHPRDASGDYISANDPGVLEQYAIGHMFNARYSDGRVKAEMWISRARAESLPDEDLRTQALDAFDRISAGEMVEVSEGNYVVIEDEDGEYNGESYSGRWVLAIPDHLAILPEGVEGACSVANHGCGAPRVNTSNVIGSGGAGLSNSPSRVPHPQPIVSNVPQTRVNVNPSITCPEVSPMKPKPKSAFSAFAQRFMSFFRPEMSNNQLRSRLVAALRELEPDVSYVTDEDPDAGTVFYCTTDYDSWETYYWRRTFTFDADGMPTLNDDRISVEPVMRYEPVPGQETPDPDSAALTANANAGCSCHKGETPLMTLKERLIAQITARSRNKFTAQSLAKMDDAELLAADEMSRDDKDTGKDKSGTTNTNVNPDGTTGDGGKSTPIPAANPLPSENPKTEVHPIPPEEQIRAQSKTVTLSAQDYLTLKAQADAQAALETEKREALLQTLSGVMKVTDGIKALPIGDLEVLVEAHTGPNGGFSFDYAGSRVITAAGGADSDMPKGWEGYTTPDTYGLKANAQKKSAN